MKNLNYTQNSSELKINKEKYKKENIEAEVNIFWFTSETQYSLFGYIRGKSHFLEKTIL